VSGPRQPGLEERVQSLEEVTANLARSTETLKRSQRETRAQVRHLADVVEGLPSAIDTKIDLQTAHLDQRIAESQAELAGQWPISAVVIVTAVLAFAVGAALHFLHWI
jgi:hypothetical protein